MPAKIGKFSQRELLALLVPLIDAASRPKASAHRDLARAKLRELRGEHWNTSFILNGISSRRCRWLASQGWAVPSRWVYRPRDQRGGKHEDVD